MVEAWRVYHESVSAAAGGTLFLNGTSPVDAGDNGGDPARIKSTNDSTITLLAYTNPYNAINASGKNYLAYCFAEKQGYSKFGSYLGNGTGANSAADGTFVHTGFKPAWVMAKATSVAQGWNIFDNKRTPTNEMGKFLYANTTGAETTGYDAMDFLSNGFKLRKNLNGANDSGQNYVYLAFAESPFVSSTGTPTTAK